MVKSFYNENKTVEIGVDEAGRGPLFGRVYTAAVILPKDDSFDHSKMKDSKKFYSKKAILEAYNYIKENAIKYSVTWNDEETIDKINIRQATLNSMHKSIKNVIDNDEDNVILVDGNDFKPFTVIKNSTFKDVPHHCIISGDNTYSCIAAASILAKVERDNYIDELCENNPFLKEYYKIDTNKGYGAKFHLEGIKKHGITKWHRRSYGPCKTAEIIN